MWARRHGDFGIALLPGGERFGQVGRFRWGEGLWLRHERRERLALPSGTRRRDAFRLRLFQNMGRAIEGVLTFIYSAVSALPITLRANDDETNTCREFTLGGIGQTSSGYAPNQRQQDSCSSRRG